jgi:hypothetical protein
MGMVSGENELVRVPLKSVLFIQMLERDLGCLNACIVDVFIAFLLLQVFALASVP